MKHGIIMAVDVLGYEIRRYTAAMLRPETPPPQDADLLASLVEEEDFVAALGGTLFEVARRVEREPFSAGGREFADAILDQIAHAMRALVPERDREPAKDTGDERQSFLISMRRRCLEAGAALPATERGRILELLGSAERAFLLIDRIDAERKSVPRVVVTTPEPIPAVSAARLTPAVH